MTKKNHATHFCGVAKRKKISVNYPCPIHGYNLCSHPPPVYRRINNPNSIYEHSLLGYRSPNLVLTQIQSAKFKIYTHVSVSTLRRAQSHNKSSEVSKKKPQTNSNAVNYNNQEIHDKQLKGNTCNSFTRLILNFRRSAPIAASDDI